MDDLTTLLEDIRACRHCEKYLPLGPRPIIRAQTSARILLIGQAPGTKVHASGIPWNDASGDRLRLWMGLDRETFYDESRVAIMPMGFCYPGKGQSGDLPPRPECAPLWHGRVMAHLPNLELILLVGSYAIHYYLKSGKKQTLTDSVRNWRDAPSPYLPLPHPSPRNIAWFKRNPWMDNELIPYMKDRVGALLGP
ncbi:MAG: uracil-DNA glycosylase family protein [Geminicoccaceae bacterium]|nr:uracil-DNA glycosylase family protein [Geminicoccaceae bacterium]